MVIEKLQLQKQVDDRSSLKYVGGQIARDGTLLLIETDAYELDFFKRPVPKHNFTVKILKSDSTETVELENIPLIPSHIDLFSDGTFLIVQLSDRKESLRYHVEPNSIRQFMFDQGGLIGQIIDIRNQLDRYPLLRFRIENQKIIPSGKIQLIDEDGTVIKGEIFLRGSFLYAYSKEGIYKKII